ncbi:hypothetical protein [Fulvivirga lutea]|uniref:Uncharacterized protein n=1 Tax=Fulvivirga lutea TaxID=2810512 RepID=A0A974WGP2_9BACT|nr:hypothetical protein [Fulvivirga lutea]QSE97343.1 hypothetical protein JR347_17435 [Fulvivirga lutea]
MIKVQNNINQTLFQIIDKKIKNSQGQVLAHLDGNNIINSMGQIIMTIDGNKGLSINNDTPLVSHSDGQIINTNGQIIGKLIGQGSTEEYTLGACAFILYA